MLYTQDRDQLRRFFCQSWQKRLQNQPLEALEQMLCQVIEQHPEYHTLIENEEKALGREYLPDDGETNPFMHLSMHLAMQEQLSINHPKGIIELYQQMVSQIGDRHQAEHQIMECMGEMMWRAQQTRSEPDPKFYLNCLQKQLKSKK